MNNFAEILGIAGVIFSFVMLLVMWLTHKDVPNELERLRKAELVSEATHAERHFENWLLLWRTGAASAHQYLPTPQELWEDPLEVSARKYAPNTRYEPSDPEHVRVFGKTIHKLLEKHGFQKSNFPKESS